VLREVIKQRRKVSIKKGAEASRLRPDEKTNWASCTARQFQVVPEGTLLQPIVVAALGRRKRMPGCSELV